MPDIYSKGWKDSNNVVRLFKDELARNAINTLNGNSSTSGSVDYKIAQATDGLVSTTDYATTSTGGVVKPDGNTITIDNDGTIHGSSGSALFVDSSGYISINYDDISSN